MKNIKTNAFTLVELIVVITILAVLATVAFISFQWYTSSSRDSVRLADLKNISKAFEINRTKWILFPLPDNKIDISASGTIFQYQWELSQKILNKEFNIFNGWVDPETLQPYWYAVNLAKNRFQLVWFLENYNSVSNLQTNRSFADNTLKYVKTIWDTLGILLDENTNDVITQSWTLTEVDIINTPVNYNAIIFNSQVISNPDIIKNIVNINKGNIYYSCKNILESLPESTDGYYVIGDHYWKQSVYCDMTTDWGWWTLFWINANSPKWYNPIDFFNWVWNPVWVIQDYEDKVSWSYDLDKLVESDLEMLITIQTEDYQQWYVANTSLNWDLFNWIMYIPNKSYFSMSDEELYNITPLNIKHSCVIWWEQERNLDFIEISNNSKMQFSTEDWETYEFMNDIWHWNSSNKFYYRPDYSYCDNTNSINPWLDVQAIFWIR